MYVTFGNRKAIDTADPDDVANVLLHQKDAFQRSTLVKAILAPVMGDGLIIADGESWRLQRSVAAPVFRQAELEKLIPVFDQAAHHLLAKLSSKMEQKVLPLLTDAAFEIITNSLFGEVDYDREKVSRDISHFLKVGGKPHIFDVFGVPPWVPRPGRRSSAAAARRLRQVSAQILARKRVSGRESGSMTDRLIRAVDPETGQKLDDRQIVDTIMTFVGAGHETTAVALSWTMWLLAHRPELQQQLREEGSIVTEAIDAGHLAQLDLHQRVFQEAMRLFPPVVSVLRSVVGPATVAGKRLSKGDLVNLVAVAMHRNPDIWPEPDKFDPDRFLPDAVRARHRFAYLPFGGGATMCIGWKFALLEATVLLHRIMQSFEVRVQEGVQPPSPEVRITMRPDNDMPLRFLPRRINKTDLSSSDDSTHSHIVGGD